jgi:MT-A70
VERRNGSHYAGVEEQAGDDSLSHHDISGDPGASGRRIGGAELRFVFVGKLAHASEQPRNDRRVGLHVQDLRFLLDKDLRLPNPRPSMGMGYWTRANGEFCLLATRGKPKRLHADVRQAVIELRREHSRKPDLYDRIERLVAGPYLELFARQLHDGWDSWGDECGKWP